MTFKEFAGVVYAEKPELTVSQKSNTEHGGVLVTFKPGGKAYLYKGSYQQILTKLGIDKMGKHEKAESLFNLQNLLDYYKRNNGEENIFTGKTNDYTEEIADIERRIKELKVK